ncbi:hypothetical protein TWF730_010003 [Orbilia blumenaviensis]|uniref:Uncharacterized protein n=1 Tax=Orbilia blumenaviensis TaxID=1796055 RepID=A0AAV9UXK1_9PEZI
MASVSVRSSMQYRGSLMQTINESPPPDIGHSSSGSLLDTKTGNWFKNIKASGPAPLWNNGSSQRLWSLYNQGCGPYIPQELSLIFLQALESSDTGTPSPAFSSGSGSLITRQHGNTYNISRPLSLLGISKLVFGIHDQGPLNSLLGKTTRLRRKRTGCRGTQASRIWIPKQHAGSFGKLLGAKLKASNPILVRQKPFAFLPALNRLRGGSGSSSANANGSVQSRSGVRQRVSSSGNAHTQKSGRESHKRKRNTGSEEEEEEDLNRRPPPSKRVSKNNPELILPLACPFAKAAPDKYPMCYAIRRKNLSGIKEHLKRRHFEGTLPDDIRQAKTWNQVFDVCNPGWSLDQHPSPHFEPRMSSKEGANRAIQKEPSAITTPLDHQKAQSGIELCSPPLSNNGLSPGAGVTPYRAHPSHQYHNIGALSPTSCTGCNCGSNRGLHSIPADDMTELQSDSGTRLPSASIPNASLWPTVENSFGSDQISLMSRHHSMSDPNWLNTSNIDVEPTNQPSFFSNSLGITNDDAPGEFSNTISFVTSSNQTIKTPIIENPFEYQGFPCNLPEESPAPWSGGSYGSSDIGTLGLKTSTSTAISGTKESLPQSISDIGIPLPLQASPELRKEEVRQTSQLRRDRPGEKKYQLIVKGKPLKTPSKEPRRQRRFTFEDLDEFHLEFDTWLRQEFTDPPFCWEKAELFNADSEANLRSVQEVADDIEHWFIQFRSKIAALYLTPRHPSTEPDSPVELINTHTNSTEASSHRQQLI